MSLFFLLPFPLFFSPSLAKRKARRRQYAGVVAVVSLLLSSKSHAAYEDIGAGARAPGMGDAFVAVADDVYTIYYNPAGLGILTRPQFGTSYTKLFAGLKDGSELNTSFIGYAHPLRDGRHGTLGAAWNSFALNGSLYREQAFYLSYGRLVFSPSTGGDFYAGVSMKFLTSALGTVGEAANSVAVNSIAKTGTPDSVLSQSKSRKTVDADLGILYRLGKHYSIGAQAMHVTQPNVAFGSDVKERLPLTLKVGFDYRSLISNLVGQVDAKKAPNGTLDHTFTLAFERWFPKLFIGDFGARGGLSLGSRDYKQLSLGMSYRSTRVQVDYGFSLPINTVDVTAGSHKMGLSFRFGRPTDEEESLEMVLEAMRQLKYGIQGPGPAKIASQGLSKGQTSILEEYLAQVRALEAAAKYKEALDKFALALTVAPADKELIASFGRLNFVGQQIKQLPLYQTDPMEATLHQGLLAYLGGNDVEAVNKISEALSIKPEYREIDNFLEQMELVTGLKRVKIAKKPQADYSVAITLTRANSAIEAGRYRDAIELSLAVLKLDAQNSSAWENLGTAYFALKDYEKSYDAWEKALEYEKSPAVRTAIQGYLKTIARVKEKRPSKSVVVESSERSLLSPAEIEKLYNQGVDLYIRREFEAAKKLFEEILQSDPNNVEARKALRRVKDELP